MNNSDNLMGVIRTIFRWKKAIRNACLLALVGSLLVSFLFLDDQFQATTIFYPASPELANPELMFGNTGQIMEYFGSDHDLDRMAEIANSSKLVDYMVDKFGLYEHYGQDSTAKKGQAKVREIFRSLYSAIKNKNDAVEISMEDTDPKLAAIMANAARDKVNDMAQQQIKESQAKLLEAFDVNIKNKKVELRIWDDSLQYLRNKYDIYDPQMTGELFSQEISQSESEITKNRGRLEILQNNPLVPRDTVEYIRSNLRAAERQRDKLRGNGDNFSLKRFSAGISQYYVVQDLHFQARKQLSYDMERYHQIKSAFNTNIPALHLVEVAKEPMIKSRPKRSIIVLGAVLAAFLFTVLAALLADTYQNVDWREALRD